MSYILDALKKADAQRQVDSMPGLHGQPVRIVFAHAAARNAWLPAGAVLTAVAVVLLAVWLWPQTQSPVQRVETVPAPTVLAQPPVLQAALPSPAPTASTEASKPAAPAALTAPASPSRTRTVERAPAVTMPSPARPPEPPAPPSATAATPATAAAAEAPEGTMPADAPRLQVTGSSYSENPAYRMLFLNGRMFREGEEVAPELRLEQIGQNSARLNFRGQRYRLSF